MGLPRPPCNDIDDGPGVVVGDCFDATDHFSRVSSCNYEDVSRGHRTGMTIAPLESHARGKFSQVDRNVGRAALEYCQCLGRTSNSNVKLDMVLKTDKAEHPIAEISSSRLKSAPGGNADRQSLWALGNPSAIIVGFDSRGSSLSESREKGGRSLAQFQPQEFVSSSLAISGKDFNYHEGPSKKKTTSPLVDMLASNANNNMLSYETGSKSLNGEKIKQGGIFTIQDSETGFALEDANTGFCVYETAKCGICHRSTPLPIPRLAGRDSNASGISIVDYPYLQTDGPVLTSKEAQALHIAQSGKDGTRQRFKQGNVEAGQNEHLGRCPKAFSYNQSPHQGKFAGLSLSPLGPRWQAQSMTFSPNKLVEELGIRTASSMSTDVSSKQSLRQWTTLDEAVLAVGQKPIVDARKEDYELMNCTSHKQALGCRRWSYEAITTSQHRSKSPVFFNGVPTRRSLVGSFEESLLSGRFLAGRACQRLDGFLALLSVTGGSWSPPLRKLPFSVTCVNGDSSLLYYASIDLAEQAVSKPKGAKGKKTCSIEDRRVAKSRFRIPIRGRVQLVLSNPEMTPVHTFLCSYDLTDMPPGTKQCCASSFHSLAVY